MKRSLRDHLAAIRRIARWEIERSVGIVDRRTAVLGVLALLVAGTILGAGALAGGVALDRDIYRVGVAADSPYREPVERSVALDPRPPEPDALADGDVEVLIRDGEFRAADTPKGRAALAELRTSVREYNTGRMQAEENGSAAFPVVAVLQYVSRSDGIPDSALADGDGAGGGTSAETDGAGGGTSAETDGGGGRGGDGGTDTAGSDDGGSDGSATNGGGGPLGVPALGGINPLGGGGSGGPADIQPPFPFGSLVLAFVFLVPMNFVVQAYGSTMLNERINRRGELLLVAPVSPGDIVAGKTLPYLGAMVAVTALIAVAVGGSVVAVAAVLPIALVFLSATFAGAMFARSFKELTFVTVTVSVFLTAYTFVPAIFTNVTPIALISPLTVVVRDLQSFASVTPGAFLFATVPFTLCAGVLFLLGIGIYREEDLFTQRAVPLKFLDALDARVSRPRDVAVLSGLSIPFVFVAELLAIAILFALPVSITVPLLLFVVAVVEELAKSLHVFAAFESGTFPRVPRVALVLGALSGLGFFVGEKFTAVAQVVGLPELALGQAAFAPSGIGIFSAAGLLFAPLVLHTVTAGLASLGAMRDLRWYAAAFVGSVLVHTAYNLTVVTSLG
ncbi:PrsW family intramembrane metalloprotease [Halobellus ordinarius]|uniref:PrsW family intramembrane metalloprotease n=1 Tax=Halobellus ordinarius TaxID=3075120 RepID=UPI002880A918|nr:PrsW family intramembrane metalloprotease [Halobellus sp. ZY16]